MSIDSEGVPSIDAEVVLLVDVEVVSLISVEVVLWINVEVGSPVRASSTLLGIPDPCCLSPSAIM